MKDPRSALPWLWVFLLVNYLYCDVVSLFDPTVIRNELAGQAANGTFTITPEFLLAAGVLMEIPMAMIVLSRALRPGVNRWANVVAAGFMAIVQLASLGAGTPAAYYLFFSAVEVGALLAIAAIAFRWRLAAPGAAAAGTSTAG